MERQLAVKRRLRCARSIVTGCSHVGMASIGVVAPERMASGGLVKGGSFKLRIDSYGSLNEPPRPRQTRCLRAIFLDGAATPPLSRRGVLASYRFVLNSSTSGALKFVLSRGSPPPSME